MMFSFVGTPYPCHAGIRAEPRVSGIVVIKTFLYTTPPDAHDSRFTKNTQILTYNFEKIFKKTFFHQSASPVCLDNQTQRSPPKLLETPQK